jgi:tRNA threonylcarbamoyladenosine biosynthesis protein TsaE
VKRTLTCRSPEETLAVGEVLGSAAGPRHLLALQGDLGTGKTLLTKGIAKGLGVAGWRYVTSPTFAIHNVYEGRLRLHHVDLYRLAEGDELEALGLDEALGGPDVCVIEWPNFFLEVLPADRTEIRFRWKGAAERELEIESKGPRSKVLWDALGEILP